MGNRRDPRSSKNVGGAGPLNRARRAIVRLTTAAAATTEPTDVDEKSMPLLGRKRGLSRKDLRKNDRAQVKQQRHRHFAQPAVALKRKRATVDVDGTEARADAEASAGVINPSARGEGARKAKRSKTSIGAAAGTSDNFIALLQAQGLIKGGGPVNPALVADDDDAEIAYYERLLKKSKPLSYDDGLDYVLDFMDELDENGQLRKDAADDNGSDGTYDVPASISDGLSKPTRRHIPAGSKMGGAQRKAAAPFDKDSDDNFDGDADLDVLLESDDAHDDSSDEDGEWDDIAEGDEVEHSSHGSKSFKSTISALDALDDENYASEDGSNVSGSDDNEDTSRAEGEDEAFDTHDVIESDDEEKDGDGAPAKHTTMYITRANAFGDNAPGGARTGTYVPPALRATDSQTLEAISRKIKGILNRVNASNLTLLLPELEASFSRHSRRDVSETLTSFVLDACVRKDRTLEHLLVVYAACVAALHQLVGMEVAAHFVQELAVRLDLHYERVAVAMAAINEEGTVDKECNNLVLMVGYLMHFQVIDATIGFDLARKFSQSLSALNIELLLTLLNCCGTRLRGNDPLALKDVTAAIAQRVTADGAVVKPRVRFMLDVITDLKHNRRKLVQDGTEEAAMLLKVIRGLVTKRGLTWRDPLRVPLKDLLQSDARGRWWLVGSAWAGRGSEAPDTSVSESGAGALAGDAAPHDPDSAAQASELLDLAGKQRMSTDLRKKIFCTVMSSADYLDAFEKLLKLKVKTKQDREIVHVVVDCCLQEKLYNPFYGHLLVKLCQHSQNHKVTLQYTFWDYFKKSDKLPLRVASHLARLMAFIVSKFALSLAFLKVVEFDELAENNILVLRLFVVFLLTHYPAETTNNVFERIADNEQLHTLRTGLVMFFKHYVRDFAVALGDGGGATVLPPEEKQALLQTRLKLAKAALMRGAGVAGIL